VTENVTDGQSRTSQFAAIATPLVGQSWRLSQHRGPDRTASPQESRLVEHEVRAG
jgi:hypothetical protein